MELEEKKGRDSLNRSGAFLILAAALLAAAGCAHGGKMTLAWDANPDPEIAGYMVYYGTSPGNYGKSVDVKAPKEANPGVVVYELTGLKKGEQYYVSVVSYSLYNKAKRRSAFSPEVSGVAK